MNNGDWSENAKLVLSELKTLKHDSSEIRGLVVECLIEISSLRTKAAYFGAAAGFLASLIPVALTYAIEKYFK